jgi:DNA-binding transcriptional MerR regulator
MEQPDPSAHDLPAELSIGDLAREAGVSPAVLRMWETRHGFPVPHRLSSGHRRYTHADVALVRQVIRLRDAGVRLETAIAEAAATRTPTSPSVFAELRRRHPSLPTHRLRKSTLIALSWAIEDQCCATAERPVLFGAFQRSAFYRPAAARWSEMSLFARSTIVLADDWDDAAPGPGPERARLAADAPMRREWAVVCDAVDSSACLTAWELPGQQRVPDLDRVFEATWTLDPVAVRDAARVAAGVAETSGVASAGPLLHELAATPAARSTDSAVGTALFNRVVSYVDRLTR